MKTLITGSSGFLGSTLINEFPDELGYIVACSKSVTHNNNPHLKSYAVDICSGEFSDIIQENSPTAIIHTAARSIVRDCEQNPSQAFMSTVQGTINVLEAARKSGHDIPIVVLETDKVYGQQPLENIPTREDHPLLGFSPYEYSKVMTANVCDFYRKYYGMKIYSLRPANIYGYWDNNKSRLIPNTFTKLLNRESPIVFSDSKDQLREYVFVNDVCKIIISMIRGTIDTPQAYNISSGEVLCPEEVIKLIMKALDEKELSLKIVEKPFKFNEIQCQALDGSLIKSKLGDNFKFTTMESALEIMSEDIRIRGYTF